MIAAKERAAVGRREQLPKMRLHEYVANQIDMSGRQQNEIAAELGYERPNIISMFKKGQTKIPINKIAPLAKAIGVDPARLLRMALLEYSPETLVAIEEILGDMVTNNERQILAVIRQETGDLDPPLRTTEQKEKLKNFARSL